MTILSKGCKPNNFKSHISLKLSSTNIWDLRSNFVDCESFLESNSPDILPQCDTNLDDLIGSGNVFVSSYIPLIQKDSTTHMDGLAFYVKEGLWRSLVFQTVGRSHWWSLYIRMVGKDLQLKTFFFFFNWHSLHARLNCHYKAWSYKKIKTQKD